MQFYTNYNKSLNAENNMFKIFRFQDQIIKDNIVHNNYY